MSHVYAIDNSNHLFEEDERHAALLLIEPHSEEKTSNEVAHPVAKGQEHAFLLNFMSKHSLVLDKPILIKKIS